MPRAPDFFHFHRAAQVLTRTELRLHLLGHSHWIVYINYEYTLEDGYDEEAFEMEFIWKSDDWTGSISYLGSELDSEIMYENEDGEFEGFDLHEFLHGREEEPQPRGKKRKNAAADIST